MHNVLWKKTGIFMLMISFIFSTFPAASLAGLVGTDEMLSADSRNHQISEIRTLLARDDVKTQMLELGVDPANVKERVNALTDAELAGLALEDMMQAALVEGNLDDPSLAAAPIRASRTKTCWTASSASARFPRTQRAWEKSRSAKRS